MSKDLVKQVIVVRKDLNMPAGKLGAQVAHASMAFLTNMLREGRIETDPWSSDQWNGLDVKLDNLSVVTIDEELAHWAIHGSFTKIVVSVQSEEELLAIYEEAGKKGCRRSIIKDEGRTVFNNIPTLTCVAVGPNYVGLVDSVTGHLKRYR